MSTAMTTQNFATPSLQATTTAALRGYATGDDSAYARLYAVLKPSLYRYFLRAPRNGAMAEDLLQQTFLRIHQARDRFQPDTDANPWVFSIARRLLIDEYRRQHRGFLRPAGLNPEPALWADEMPADEAIHRMRMVERVDEHLRKLPDGQRRAYELVAKEGYPPREAACQLGTTVNAIKVRLHRVRTTMRSVVLRYER